MTSESFDKNSIVENFKEQGIKIIPVKYMSKEPDVPDFGKYLSGEKIYEEDILPNQNYGVICGALSDNLVILDLEKIHPEDYWNKVAQPRHIPIEPEFLNKIMPGDLNQTFTSKTGSGGGHTLLKGEKIPQTTSSYDYVKDHNNIYHLDFKVTGMCVEAGSIHPNGNPYEIISNVRTIKKVNLKSILSRLEKIGFKPQGKSKTHLTNFEDYKAWTVEELQQGSWARGERRRKQKSLYLRLRRLNNKITDVKKIIKDINLNLDEPLDNKELEINFESAEQYFNQEVLPKYGYVKIDTGNKMFGKKEWPKVRAIIQDEINYLTIRETLELWYYDKVENFYKPKAHTKIMERAEELIFKCNKGVVNEIIESIKRNKTMIDTKKFFESLHCNTQNGILDLDTFEIKTPSAKYYTTSKLPFSVDFKANNFKLWHHILTIIDGKDMTKIMELIWMLISGDNPHKKAFFFMGLTGTQKTTLVAIISWIIGNENLAKQKPESFLKEGMRFGTNHFVGKRGNYASELGNFTAAMLENLKSWIGGEIQNSERKGSNEDYPVDPTKFTLIFTTNKLGDIYSKLDDNSIITRLQFIIFRKQIAEIDTDGHWDDKFFDNKEDKQSAINTVVRLVIEYKKAQSLGKAKKLEFSSIAETKQILREEMPLEDKYFDDERIIRKEGSSITHDEVKTDFESFVSYKVKFQKMGMILKNHGVKTSQSNGRTLLRGWVFNTKKDQVKLTGFGV